MRALLWRKDFTMLKKNEGFMDRFARVVLGIGVLSLRCHLKS